MRGGLVRGLGLLATGAALGLAGCALTDDPDTTTDVDPGSVDPTALEDAALNVGSKQFDEQLLLGQLTIQMLAAAGAEVTDDTDIQGSTATRQALLRGDIDVYYDYTGTGWTTYLGHASSVQDPAELYEAVRAEDRRKNGLVWGEPAPFDNAYAMAVTRQFAERTDVATLSDMSDHLAAHPDATVCIEAEFASRPDGLPGLAAAYEMPIPNSTVTSADVGDVYERVERGRCDFGEVFTTDGRVGFLDLVPLTDDRGFFPPYNGAPIVRAGDPDSAAILEVLAPLTDTLTTEVMTELNAQVSVDGLRPERVARAYLRAEGFIE